MNISFTKLGHEECESCEQFNVHPHNKENLMSDCVYAKSGQHITHEHYKPVKNTQNT